MAKVSDAQKSEAFRPPGLEYHYGKSMQRTLTYGQSKDSPFRSAYTIEHPSTKQLLDFGNSNKETMPGDLNNLKPDQLLQLFSRVTRPAQTFTKVT